MGLDIDLYTPKIDISDDNTDDIIIEVTGLKSISKFIGLEDTPLYYDNGKFFKVEDNKIVYANIQWKDISGDISESPEIIAVISDLVNEVASDIADERINLHNLNEETHPYIQDIIKQNYNTLDTKIDNTKEELSEALNTETTNRETADNELSENIQQETLARIEADTTLQNNIDTLTNNLNIEIENRTNADNLLRDDIDNISGELAQEIINRQTQDNLLQEQIISNYNTLDDKIDAEISNRISADTTLQGNIDTLSNTVSDNYTNLDGKISDLTDTVNNNDTVINNKVDGINTTLTNSINSLSNTVSSNYTTLDTKIDNTKTSLEGDISDLNDVIDNLSDTVSDNYTDLDDKITDNTDDITAIQNTINFYGDIVSYNANDFATANQGALAGTALQPNDNISELTNDMGYITTIKGGTDINVVNSLLPNGYTQLDYIESTGTQYIDTGYKPSNTTKVKTRFSVQEPISFVFGSLNSTSGANQKRFGLLLGNLELGAHWLIQYANTNNSISNYELNIVYDVEMSESGFYVDGTKIFPLPPTVFTGDYNMYLFANNTADTSTQYGSVKIYSFQIYDNNILIHDYIPCKNSSNVIGMYDIVTNTFFTNAGTGDFVAGLVSTTYYILFSNESGYITNSVNNLTNYYTKTEIDNTIGDIETALHNINSGGN